MLVLLLSELGQCSNSSCSRSCFLTKKKKKKKYICLTHSSRNRSLLACLTGLISTGHIISKVRTDDENFKCNGIEQPCSFQDCQPMCTVDLLACWKGQIGGFHFVAVWKMALAYLMQFI
jgi:hypothetical protein